MLTPEEISTDSHAVLSRALGERYSIQRVIGRGATSVVCLAHDKAQNRPVAVKFLRRELAAGVGAKRFLREIRVASRLQHPHIVPIYDSGDTDTALFLIMPYLAGETLRERLERERQLPLAEALRLTREVADALSFAHSQNIVHRDIKPENVMLVDGHALVVDFGIAKALCTASSISSTGETLSVEGLFIGTPLYMAPEQMFSDLPVDERADVYGLATVLYEMLEGRTPYEGPTNAAIFSRKAARAAEAPSRTLEPLPPHLQRALLKALERDRDNRFASVAEFQKALIGGDAPLSV